MKLCRFNDNRLGLIKNEEVLDVTEALDVLPAMHWPYPPGDLLISHLDLVCGRASELEGAAKSLPLRGVILRSPVANPSKIINAPINYHAHVEEAKDPAIAHGRDVVGKTIADWGLFLTANTSLIGSGDDLVLRAPERRNDHELELVVVIGKQCSHVSAELALDVVAGYAVGLDMTIRGPEFPSFRKSSDSYSVCGPWLTTADEIADPNQLDLTLRINGVTRQQANTRSLIFGIERLIEYASSMYTLFPGDLIYTGTPEGVGPVQPNDLISASIQDVGEFNLRVASRYWLSSDDARGR